VPVQPAATALALANLGHTVDLVDLPRRVPARGEVLRAVARDALERLGLWDDFAALGFPPSMGTVSAWGRRRTGRAIGHPRPVRPRLGYRP
jgi:2-polyprenyl-6-methoxyphenol hydroxylase-like FAD-dependent oxidoreductase